MNIQILEEAADWLIELNSGDPDTTARQKFDAWLRTSPEHVRAYLELLPAWEAGAALPARRLRSEAPNHSDTPTTTGEHPQLGRLTVEELIAMGRAAAANVFPIGLLHDGQNATGRFAPTTPPDRSPAEMPASPHAGEGQWRRHWIAWAASLLLAAFLTTGLYLHSRQGLYATEVGEQRIVRLADGSTVELNSRSIVRIRYSHHDRDVELLDGQALFRVAHDPDRPFTVATRDTRVRAVGTQFDVYRKNTGTVVTVVEGRVAIATALDASSSPTHSNPERDQMSEARPSASNPLPLNSHPGELILTAGEQLTVTPTAAPTRKAADVTKVTAWTRQRLVFDASTLSEVIEEFNRYNTRQLVLKDPSLGSLPITAAFSSPDPTPLVRFLRTQTDIDIRETPREIVIARK